MFALLTYLVVASATSQTREEPPPPLLVRSFDEPDALAGASVPAEGAKIVDRVGRDGSRALVIDRPVSGGPGSTAVQWSLPIEELRGRRVRVEALVKADGVATPPKPYNGVKLMLHIAGATNEWPQAPMDHGSFGWTQAGFTVAVPDDAKSAELTLGLEATTGKVTFDDLRITVRPPRRASAGTVADPRHGPGRLRGVMIGTGVDAEDLRTLAKTYGANHVRWQLLWDGFPNGPADTATPEQYDQWLDSELDRLARLLPVCQEEGISVLIDLHTPPGGRFKGGRDVMTLFRQPEVQQHFVRVWERIVSRFRDEPAVWGYDLLNEPVVGSLPAGVKDWPELALEAAQHVRKLDSKKAIIVEPAPWGSPEGLDDFEPLPGIDGVVYSVHMYLPHHFTHQGVHDNPIGVTYPGTIDGQVWGKEELRKALEPARRFERDFGVPIYIGEFSAIRWAPGSSAHDWLRDVIDIMEGYGWDWAYHAYREWDGWSFEHSADPKDHERSRSLTDREALLKSYFERNRLKPAR
jgi:aryl-phospho-beta-D-glucosidase BglC (GH1 family)